MPLMGKKMSQGVNQTTGNLNWGALLFVGLGAVLLVVAWQGTQGKLWQAITGSGTTNTPTNSPANPYSVPGWSNSTTLQPLQLTPQQICAAFPIQCITQQPNSTTSSGNKLPSGWTTLQPLAPNQPIVKPRGPF